jgi:fumarate reductase iron-sulfur subunit
MGTDLSKVSPLARRATEARVVRPLIQAFMEEIGRERTLEIAGRRIRALARESGAQLVTMMGGTSLEHFAEALERTGEDNALEHEILEKSPTRSSGNTTRWGFAEMYRKLGIPEWGYRLSCGRDFPMIEGFNPRIWLTRTQTPMEGASHCDFRFQLEQDEGSEVS